MRGVARAPLVLLRYAAIAAIGFLVGILALLVVRVRSGPDLQIWHTERLSEEFTAEKGKDGIRTFEGYRELEDVLFGQLDQLVYQEVQTGPEFGLVRYSAGSLADPRIREKDWNRSFELASDEAVGGVLLLHGMSDSPYSLRSLGEAFHERGFHVVGLRLPGHGTAPSGLLSVTAEDMIAAVRLAAGHLGSRIGSKPMHIVGYSTGAPLALAYAVTALDEGEGLRAPESLILISPSIAITPAAALAKWLRRLSLVPGLRKLAWTAVLPEFDPYKYNSFTANAGDQVHRLTTGLYTRLNSLSANGPIEDFPRTLVFQSTVDATVSPAAVIDNLLQYFVPGRHELVLFDVNRNRIKSTILVADPGPLTARLMADESLPFWLTLVGNATADTGAVVIRTKAPFAETVSAAPLEARWPRGVISLSHVALPFPPDDPLYGRREFAEEGQLSLGQIDMQGERNLLKFPSDWLLRLRYNPFYNYLEERSLAWIQATD